MNFGTVFKKYSAQTLKVTKIIIVGGYFLSSCSYQSSTPDVSNNSAAASKLGTNINSNVSKEDLKNIVPENVQKEAQQSQIQAPIQNQPSSATQTASPATPSTKPITQPPGLAIAVPNINTQNMGNAQTQPNLPATAQTKTVTPVAIQKTPSEISTGSAAAGKIGAVIPQGSLPISKGTSPSQPVTVGSISKPDSRFGEGFFGKPEEKKEHIAIPVEAPSRCFTVTYKHKRTFGHTTDEECSTHTNSITLKHSDVNANSVCIKVNGRPVSFKNTKNKTNEIIIGAIAGPGAVITARYCTGQYNCTEECKVPKDEFMDAIGGGNEASGLKSGIGHWEPSDVKENLGEKLRKELAAFDEPDTKFSEVSAFTGWTSESDDALPACKANQISTVLSAQR